MTRILPILGLAAAGFLCIAADTSLVDKAFGNTILQTYPDGRTGELWLAPGGTYTAQGRRHDPSNGRWKLKGGKICFKQISPRPILPITICKAMPMGKVGASWSDTAVTGEKIQVKLVMGHVTGPH
ncbi:MAG TPA: hypothetical protein VII73_14040 [Caulobacteraceae bacterium]